VGKASPAIDIALTADLTINTQTLTGKKNGKPILFTRREIDILHYLKQEQSRPIPRQELLEKVWGYCRNSDIDTRTVDTHISRIRHKLELLSQSNWDIVTVYGYGYRLQSEQEKINA